MDWVSFAIRENGSLSPSQQQQLVLVSQSPIPPPITTIQTGSFNGDSKISPSILLIIIILAVIFFISGLLHLLVRFLLRPPSRDPDDLENVTALQGQLQQLFHLHDSGVDQSYIDTLPVFLYKAIIGLKNPFDCAVCLCEFESDDKLRLLPKCSHAFHLECIDTWLLSHSTCPLCRGSLIPDFSPNNSCSPVVLVLESGSESSREIVADRGATVGINSVTGTGPHLGLHGENEFGSSRDYVYEKPSEIPVKEDISPVVSEEKIVLVKLGKFRNVDAVTGGGEGSSSSSNLDARRCFSMGSFEYVMDENSSLQVPIRPPIRKLTSKKPSLPLTPGHRPAMSECDCNSRREGFKGFEAVGSTEIATTNGDASIKKGNEVGRSKRESFSISKIWLRSKEKRVPTTDSSRRAFSLRFPLHRSASNDLKSKQIGSSRRTVNELEIARWESGGSELCFDEEVRSCNNLDSQANPPSFARRTLLWLVGRQNKVVHSSSSHNV